MSQHPTRTLLRALSRRARVGMIAAAAASLLERLLIVAVTFEAVSEHASYAAALTGVLAILFFARTVVRSLLRVEVQARLIEVLSEALLVDSVEIGDAASDTAEIGLFEGLLASEALVGDHVPSVLGDLPACAGMVVIALALMPATLVLEGCAVMTLGAGAVLISRTVSSRTEDRVWEAFGSVMEDLSAVVRGRIELVASGTGDGVLAALRLKVRQWRAISTRASALSFLAGRAPAVAVAVAAGLVLVLDEGLRGAVLHGVLGRAALLASLSPAFAGVARASLEIARSGPRIAPIADLIERGAPRLAAGARPLPDLPAVIALDHVDFAYSTGRPLILHDLVATLAPGSVVAVTGANGSGKSTLFALLLGLAVAAHGSISIAGVDLRDVNLRSWRRRVGYLSQRPFLPDRATAGAAMRLLVPDADDGVLERALRQVRLWPVLCVRSPSAPLDVKVGSLSAGEKQRLALARVLARSSPVLLLDEPDANLDAQGVEMVAELLRELTPGRCIVIAAHSPHLIAVADRVVSLAKEGPALSARSPVAAFSPGGQPS